MDDLLWSLTGWSEIPRDEERYNLSSTILENIEFLGYVRSCLDGGSHKEALGIFIDAAIQIWHRTRIIKMIRR